MHIMQKVVNVHLLHSTSKNSSKIRYIENSDVSRIDYDNPFQTPVPLHRDFYLCSAGISRFHYIEFHCVVPSSRASLLTCRKLSDYVYLTSLISLTQQKSETQQTQKTQQRKKRIRNSPLYFLYYTCL